MRGHRTRTEFTAHLRKCAKSRPVSYLTDADRVKILKSIEARGLIDIRTSETSGNSFGDIFYSTNQQSEHNKPINIGYFTRRQTFDEYTKGMTFNNGNYCFIDGALYVFEDGEWIFYSKAI